MQRALCVWFPDWPLQRLCAARPELKGQPVVLFGESPRGGFQVVHGRCEGISPGVPLAEARASSPHARFERYDPSADSEALRTLAGECQRFSPLVGTGEEGSLLMDVTGCAPHFGGEQPLASQVAKFMARSGLVSRVSIADTIGAAWAVCRYGRAGVVPRGERALDSLPAAALRLPSSIVETLAELDIRTIGQLRALPRGSLTSRFGACVANRLDQAFGQLPELILPIKATEAIRAEWTFDEPVTDRRSLELSLHGLLEQVADALRERQLGVQRLTCRIDDVSFAVGTTSPTTAVPHLWDLVRLHLERLALPGEVMRVEIHALLTARRVEQQRQIIPDERVDQRELRLLSDRLCSRLGDDAVVRPGLVPDPLPEFACRFAPLPEGEGSASAPNPVGLFRPVRIHPQPIAVEAVSVVPDGPPIRFRWKSEDHTINHHWGPERIASGWWRETQVRRDYYRVETTTGRRFWLFRAEGTWFLHGVFE
jgi:protein ImuB